MGYIGDSFSLVVHSKHFRFSMVRLSSQFYLHTAVTVTDLCTSTLAGVMQSRQLKLWCVHSARYFTITGVKGVGFVTGPVIKTRGVVNHQLMHVSDWFPTLINMAGGSLNGTKPDGYDMWQSITQNKTSPRDVSILMLLPVTCFCFLVIHF